MISLIINFLDYVLMPKTWKRSSDPETYLIMNGAFCDILGEMH